MKMSIAVFWVVTPYRFTVELSAVSVAFTTISTIGVRSPVYVSDSFDTIALLFQMWRLDPRGSQARVGSRSPRCALHINTCSWNWSSAQRRGMEFYF